jgi:polyvinyl alcohol dehydrogenase (cytochrome)
MAFLVIILLAFGSLLSAQMLTRKDALFSQACGRCHDQGDTGNAPPRSTLVKMTPEVIYRSLTTGRMRFQAQNLSDDAKKGLAEFLGGRALNVGDLSSAQRMSNPCGSNPPIRDLSGPSWNGWGVDLTNSRFQRSTQLLTEAKIHGLSLKWAFGLPGATAAYSLPTVIAGRVFIGTDTGSVYSIDAETGCIYWSFQADGQVRTAISVGLTGGTAVAYFGDQKANAYAIDATTGKLVWRVSIEDHPIAKITGSPVLYKNRLYVPVASEEESAGGIDDYPCCTFQGSVSAIDAATGKQIWKTYTIATRPIPIKKNSRGVQQWAPAGAGVWSSPTLDVERNLLYVDTGDAYTEPAAETSDSIIAMDLATGKIKWSVQESANDAWLSACGPPVGYEHALKVPDKMPDNCPTKLGPDNDFGSPPILKKLPDGHSILVAALRSGQVSAHDPDRQGAVVWRADLGSFTLWGAAMDDNAVYYGLKNGGAAALKITSGELAWTTHWEPSIKGHPGNDEAISLIPGFLFVGGEDGTVRALSTDSGKEVWHYDTARDLKTVNGIAAHGGTIAVSGVSIVGSSIFVGSGYTTINGGLSGNLLVAFEPFIP